MMLPVMEQYLGLLAQSSANQSTDTGLWQRKVQCLLQGAKQGEQAMIKKPELPNGFQGEVSKGSVREGAWACGHLVLSPQIG